MLYTKGFQFGAEDLEDLSTGLKKKMKFRVGRNVPQVQGSGGNKFQSEYRQRFHTDKNEYLGALKDQKNLSHLIREVHRRKENSPSPAFPDTDRLSHQLQNKAPDYGYSHENNNNWDYGNQISASQQFYKLPQNNSHHHYNMEKQIVQNSFHERERSPPDTYVANTLKAQEAQEQNRIFSPAVINDEVGNLKCSLINEAYSPPCRSKGKKLCDFDNNPLHIENVSNSASPDGYFGKRTLLPPQESKSTDLYGRKQYVDTHQRRSNQMSSVMKYVNHLNPVSDKAKRKVFLKYHNQSMIQPSINQLHNEEDNLISQTQIQQPHPQPSTGDPSKQNKDGLFNKRNLSCLPTSLNYNQELPQSQF
jgi:hypothetical protein